MANSQLFNPRAILTGKNQTREFSMAAPQSELDPESIYCGILIRTQRAFQLAQFAAGSLANALAINSATAYLTVENAGQQFGELDTVIGPSITPAIPKVTPARTREFLACTKFLIDLAWIGDLLASASRCAHGLGDSLGMEDLNDLAQMASVLENMLMHAHHAYWVRDFKSALLVLRTDSEVDRLRNLVLIRHLEQGQSTINQDIIQILFIAQVLERAGDHAKNVAKEICHLLQPAQPSSSCALA
jgi:phosphate transport system protein